MGIIACVIAIKLASTSAIVADYVLQHGEDWEELTSSVSPTLTSKDCKKMYMQLLRSMFDSDKKQRNDLTSSSILWDAEKDDMLLNLYETNPYLTNPIFFIDKYVNAIINQMHSDRNTLKRQSNLTMLSSTLPNQIYFSGWRNISHLVKISSVECRRRLYLIKFGIDFLVSADYWYDWEYIQLFILANGHIIKSWYSASLSPSPSQFTSLYSLIQSSDHKMKFHDVSRTLGRTAMQCYNCYTNSKQYQLYSEKLIQYFDLYITPNNNSLQKVASSPFSLEALLSTKSSISSSMSSLQRSRKVPWTEQEDSLLLQLVKQYGRKWKHIGSLLAKISVPTAAAVERSPVVCCARYQQLKNYIHENEDKSEISQLMNSYARTLKGSRSVWNESTLKQLCELVTIHGANWKLITQLLKLPAAFSSSSASSTTVSVSAQSVRSAYIRQVKKHPSQYLIPTKLHRLSNNNSFDYHDSKAHLQINATDLSSITSIQAIKQSSQNNFKQAATMIKTHAHLREVMLNSKQMNKRKIQSVASFRAKVLASSAPSSNDLIFNRSNLLSVELFNSTIISNDPFTDSLSDSNSNSNDSGSESASNIDGDDNSKGDSDVDINGSGRWTREDDKLLRQLLYLQTSSYRDVSNSSNGSNNSNGSNSSNDSSRTDNAVAMTLDHWTAIAERMNRSPEDVMLRYDFKLYKQKHIKQGGWRRTEDAQLLQFVESEQRRIHNLTSTSNSNPSLTIENNTTTTSPSSSPSSPSSSSSSSAAAAIDILEVETPAALLNNIMINWSEIGQILNRSAVQCSLRYRVSLDPRLKWKLWTAEEDSRLVLLREDKGYNWVMISAVLDRASSSCRYRYLSLKNRK